MTKIKISIEKNALEPLSELQRRMRKDTSGVINELLIQQYKSFTDDELCTKDYFPNCIIYQVNMQFCFPFECERFEIKQNKNIILYIERIPKRYVLTRMPFITNATIIIELNESDFPSKTEKHIIVDKIQNDHLELAYKLLRDIIIQYRRITRKYYNIGSVKPPMNLEEFTKNLTVTIIKNKEYYSINKLMRVKEGSDIVVKLKLDEDIRSKIIKNITSPTNTLFTLPYDFFDQSIVSYYDEEWNLCLIQGVIAMESLLSELVLNKKILSDKFSQLTKNELMKEYKKATGLPKKLQKFLFPFLKEKKLTSLENDLKIIMPIISDKTKETRP
jgi:hypothetical protein